MSALERMAGKEIRIKNKKAKKATRTEYIRKGAQKMFYLEPEEVSGDESVDSIE